MLPDKRLLVGSALSNCVLLGAALLASNRAGGWSRSRRVYVEGHVTEDLGVVAKHECGLVAVSSSAAGSIVDAGAGGGLAVGPSVSSA